MTNLVYDSNKQKTASKLVRDAKGQTSINDFDEIQLKLTCLLQTTLELEPLLDLFFSQLQHLLKLQSVEYTFINKNSSIKLGTKSVHSAYYNLTVAGQSLGAINFTRRQRFAEEELTQLESLLSTLVYPLRNALTYREALHKAQSDPLTGLGNRGALEHSLEHELNMARRYGQDFSFMVLDIDFFKKVNDTYGHDIGDQVLRSVASSLNATTRQTDMAFRYGGEEFVVLLGKTNALGAAIIAERIRENIEHLVVNTSKVPLSVTVSIGVSTLTNDMDSKELFSQADKALYSAKNNGRNRVEIACLKASMSA